MMRASVQESEYYFGISNEMIVSFPTDYSLVLVGAIGAFTGVSFIAVIRKRRGNRTVTPAPSRHGPELGKALEEERELIPERVRERTKKRIAELDGLSQEGVESHKIESGIGEEEGEG